MNKNLFFTILLILLLGSIIALTIMIGNNSKENSIKFNYDNTPGIDYSNDFTLNNFKCGKVIKNDFIEYETYPLSIEIAKGKLFYHSAIVTSPAIIAGEVVSSTSLLGYIDGKKFYPDDNGVVLNIEELDNGQNKITYTQKGDLQFSVFIPLEEINLLKNDFDLELVCDDESTLKLKLDRIDFIDTDPTGVYALFTPVDTDYILFPHSNYEARRVKSVLKDQLCISNDFFSSYNSSQYKSFQVFYIDNSEIKEFYITTAEKFDGYTIISNLDSSFENLTIYMKDN